MAIPKRDTRNQLEGVLEDIQMGSVMAHVTVRVGSNLVESMITRRSVRDDLS